jgi:hypothetical protein
MIAMVLALMAIMTAGVAGGILLAIQHRAHVHAEQQADEDALAEVQELYAAWAIVLARRPGGGEPSGLDRRDRLPI